MISDRERFCAILYTGPLLKSDAIVVLCGEDAKPRYEVALQLLRQEAAQFLLLSGGLNDPPAKLCAMAVEGELMGLGVSPSRILVESGSFNTREQAVAVVKLAIEKKWKRILLCVSPYHAPRSFLTLLQAIHEKGLTKKLQIVLAPASAKWFERPAGIKPMRYDLLDMELEKIEEYERHVASYADGINYLRHWEAA